MTGSSKSHFSRRRFCLLFWEITLLAPHLDPTSDGGANLQRRWWRVWSDQVAAGGSSYAAKSPCHLHPIFHNHPACFKASCMLNIPLPLQDLHVIIWTLWFYKFCKTCWALRRTQRSQHQSKYDASGSRPFWWFHHLRCALFARAEGFTVSSHTQHSW